MAEPEEHSTGYVHGGSLVVGVGGFLTITTGISISVLAFVLMNTVIGGNVTVATLSLLGIVLGVGIYYVGMGELLGSRP